MIMKARRIMTLLLALVLVVSMLAFDVPDAAYAAAKKPAKVKWTSVKRSGSKAVLKWKKAKNAKKYQVYSRIKGAKWKLSKTLKKRTIKLAVKTGKTYQYKVRGVNGKKKGNFSVVRTLKVTKKKPSGGDDPVVEPDPSVVITAQPQDATVKDGEQATFSITAELSEKAAAEGVVPTYQWYRNRAGGNESGTRISGAESAEYTFNADMIHSGTYYFCIITAGNEKIKSEAAKLTVTYGDRVYILSSSGDVDIVEGETATFSVEAAGAKEMSYQWYISDSAGTSSGEPIKGANAAEYKTRAYLYNNNKYYYCRVTDETTEGYSKPAKLTTSESEEHRQAVADIKALIDEYGVMTTNTVSIDGLDFYVIANENGKALLLAKQPSSYYEHSISDNNRWDCNYEGIDFYGEGSCYADDDIDLDEEQGKHYGAIVELNTYYLDKNPTIDCIAASVKTYTLKGGEFSMNETDYYCLTKKIFILTQGDVTGMYAGENSAPYDYTFNLAQHWQHFGNPMPAEIVNLYVDGELVPWFVRSPYEGWNEDWKPARVVGGAASPTVEAVTDEDDVKAYARPAFWVDLSD